MPPGPAGAEPPGAEPPWLNGTPPGRSGLAGLLTRVAVRCLLAALAVTRDLAADEVCTGIDLPPVLINYGKSYSTIGRKGSVPAQQQ
jgi:hypothetical protein